MSTYLRKLKIVYNNKEILIYGDKENIIIRKEDLSILTNLPGKELLNIPEIFLDDWEYEARTIEINQEQDTIFYSDDNTINEWRINLI